MEVQRFQGLASFYQRFIQQFSTIMAPIIDCMKSRSFSWTKEVKEAFKDIKRCLTNALIFVLLDFNIPIELHVNALKTRIGIVMSQEGRPIAHFSEKLSKGKLCYSTYDIEFYVFV